MAIRRSRPPQCGHGRLHPGRWTPAVVLDAAPLALLWGHPLEAGTLNVYPPGGENDARYAAGYAVAALMIEPGELAATAESLVPELVDRPGYPSSSYHLTTQQAAPLQCLFRKAIDALVVTTTAIGGSAAGRVMRDELLHAYLITLRNAVLGERRPDCRTWLNAARVVRLAEEYVRSREDEPIRLDKLASACGIERRTLTRAFHRFLGMGPGTYLRQRRLSAARHDLLTAPLRAETVTEVAFRWGFWHLSRFAREYRSMFGESPSETVRRSL